MKWYGWFFVFAFLCWPVYRIEQQVEQQLFSNVARVPASVTCTDAMSAFFDQNWKSVDDVYHFQGINPEQASVLANYLKSIPEDLKARLLKKFQGQSAEQTKLDLEEMFDLHKINGSCK